MRYVLAELQRFLGNSVAFLVPPLLEEHGCMT